MGKQQDASSGQTASEIPVMRFRAAIGMIAIVIAFGGLWFVWHPFRGAEDLLVVGYDSSRGYIMEASRSYGETRLSDNGRILSQHSGSVQQAENLARGLAADIVFLASRAEMSTVEKQTGCFQPDWAEAFPYGSSPVTSTIVLLVRNGNPLGLSEWEDLYRRGVRVAAPDPRWSGAGRYAYLALMADALARHGNDPRSAGEKVRPLLMRMKLIPLGAHSALDVFGRSPQLDVFLTWESEALRVTKSGQSNEFSIVYPSSSIKAEPVVAVMTCQTERRNTTEAARSFIDFLYSAEGQKVAAESGLRPQAHSSILEGSEKFPPIELWEVESMFGDWQEVWDNHLGPAGSFAFAMKLRSALEGGVE